jgi:hypothetical protein
LQAAWTVLQSQVQHPAFVDLLAEDAASGAYCAGNLHSQPALAYLGTASQEIKADWNHTWNGPPGLWKIRCQQLACCPPRLAGGRVCRSQDGQLGLLLGKGIKNTPRRFRAAASVGRM